MFKGIATHFWTLVNTTREMLEKDPLAGIHKLHLLYTSDYFKTQP